MIPALAVLAMALLQLLPLQHFAAAGETPRPWIAAYPDRARDSIRTWMAEAVKRDPRTATALLARADRLGAEYARVWGDSFPLRDLQRFSRLSPTDRRRRVRADSLRRSGNTLLGREGFNAAARDWHASRALGVALGDTAVMAAALGNIGTGFYREAQLDSASRYYAEARHLARLAGDRRTELNAVSGLASIYKDRGDYDAADRRYRESLFLRRQIGDYRGVAADANNLGLVAAATGKPAEARRRHLEALVTAREHGFDDAAAATLLNLGGLASSEGDDRVARQRYGDALALYRKLDAPADQALALRNLGLLSAGQGDYPAAATNYQEAIPLLEQSGPAEVLVGTQVDLSQVLAAMGDLDGAERALKAADGSARRDALSPSTIGRLYLARGDLAFDFNRLSSARELYQRGLTLYRATTDGPGEAEALAALGGLSLIEDDNAGALRFLNAAAAGQQSAGDSRSAALTTLLAARASRALGDTADAGRRLAWAVDTLRLSGDRVAHAWGLCELGQHQQAGRSLRAAEQSYRAGLTRLGRAPAIGASVCLYGGLAQTLRMRGATTDAITALQEGIARVEAAATGVGTVGRRSDFLSDKWELYTDLALAQRAAGSDAAAFATSERLRARQTLSLVTDNAASTIPATASPRLLALRRRIADLLDVSRAHENTVALRGVEERPEDRRAALAQAESDYGELLDSLELANRRDPPRPVAATDWREIATRLPADAVLIEYLVTDSTVLAFVVTPERLSVVPLPLTGIELATEVDFVRGLLTPKSGGRSDTPWQAPLRRLHGQLITPLENAGLLSGKRRLLIVPHRQLHYLPFAALMAPGSGGSFLIEQYQVGHVASGAVWLRLQARPARQGQPTILALAPRPAELPGARAEVQAIGALFGDQARVVIGERATREFLATAAPGRSILHLASRGILNRHNPRFSYVALAAGRDSDGRLEVHDVTRLSIDARLVVLSACQTGLGSGRLVDVPPGDDWVGLVQAFQSAGARNVLATLWPVDDQATAGLMRQFYISLRSGQAESSALAEAQRRAIAQPSTRSPFYWAGFVLNGDL